MKVTDREPAITEMIDLVQQVDRRVRELSVADAKAKKTQRSKVRRQSFRRAMRRALKR